MRIIRYPSADAWKSIIERPHLDMSQLNDTVRTVINDVRAGGDDAVRRYEEKFDHVALTDLKVCQQEIDEAEDMIDGDLKQAIRQAHENIYRFHSAQSFNGIKVTTAPGVECWQRSVPI